MAPRPAWKGYLKLSLVTCAVELTNATTNAEKVSFHVLNRKTGERVKRVYIDAETGEAVEDKDQVKGYEVDKEQYLQIEEEEIEAVEIESSHTLSLESFVEKTAIDQIYLDQPYYLAPADKVSEEAFAVIREALEKKKMAGLARIVLYRRERPVVIEPLGKGMLLTTLRYDNTVRKAETIFDEVKDVQIDEDMLDLAGTIIDRKAGEFDPAKFEDGYENALLELIEAKKKGRKPPTPKEGPKQSNVVNLFDALKKSLASEAKPAAKAEGEPKPKKPAAKPKAKPAASKRKSA